MVWLWISAVSWAGSPCAEPSETAELAESLSAVEQAFVDLDAELLLASAEAARFQLPCLGDRLLSADAAAFHRSLGLEAFIEQREAEALSFFRAAAAIEPGALLPTRYAPSGGALSELYEEARRQPPEERELLDVPKGYVAYLNGARTSERPLDIPVIFQLIEESGAVVETALLQPGEAPRLPEPPPPAKRPVKLAVGAGVSALAAAGLQVLALTTQNDVYQGCAAGACPEETVTLNRVAWGTSLISGTVALGLGTAAVVKW